MAISRLKRVCPLLERESPTRILSYAPAPWVLRQCLETKFVFLENPPAYEQFKEEYAWEVTSRKESEMRKKAEPLLYTSSSMIKEFRRRILKRNKMLRLTLPLLLKSRSDTINLLDIGCGCGQLLENVHSSLPSDVKRRCVPHGIEISKELARISNENLSRLGGQCLNDTALDGIARFGAIYFDVIVMQSFLEHEINPMPTLRCCVECLRPGGCIVVKVPNYACINRLLRGARWCGFRWPDHVNYFTPQTLKAISCRAGLQFQQRFLLDWHLFSDNMYAVLSKSVLPAANVPEVPL